MRTCLIPRIAVTDRPDMTLRVAAREAGIWDLAMVWPLGAIMEVRTNVILVSRSPDAPWVELAI